MRSDTLMAIPVKIPEHIPNQQLILVALGHGGTELTSDLAAHLAACDACRGQVEAYRTVLAATRDTLTADRSRVNLVSLDQPLILENSECEIGDNQHTLRVTLRIRAGALQGHLTVDETCTCWQNAPVRLFGPDGLVASSSVDGNREFQLPVLEPDQRYSLGLVLTRREVPELQIIGSFQVG